MGGTKYPLSLVIQAVDRSTGALRAWNARMQKLTQPLRVPLRRLGNRLTALSEEAGVPRLLEGFKGVGSAVGKVRDEVFALGKRLLAVAGIATAVFFGLTRGAVDAGDELAEVADRLKFTVTGFASLRFAAQQADVPAEKFTESMDQLNRRMGEMRAGGGPLLSFLQRVSPALARQLKGTKSTEQAWTLLVQAFEKVKDPAKRAALSAAVFGKGGKQMAEFAGMGGAAIGKLRDRFVEISGDQERFARGAGELDNAMRESQVALLGLRNAVAAELFPALTELAKVATGLMAGNRQGLAAWARSAGKAISEWVAGGGVQRLVDGLKEMFAVGRRLFDALGGWPTVLVAVAAVMAGPLLGAIGGLISAVITLGAAIGFTPVGWILAGLAAIAAIAVVVWRNFDRIKAVVGPAFAPAREHVRELWAQLQRLWGVLGPVLTPALRTLGKVLGAVLIIQLQQAGQVLGVVVDLMGRWVGFLVDVADWAVRAGAAIVEAFQAAHEKVKPILDAMSKVSVGGALGMAVGAGQTVAGWLNGGDRPALGAASALPAGAGGGGETRVVVDFNGMPRGGRVTADPQGTAPLDLSVGYSMLTP